MTSLAQRLDALVQSSGLSARGLSLKAGLSGGYLGTALSRMRGRGEAPTSRLGTEQLAALASAGGASFDWLAFGNGNPPADPRANARRFESIAAALAALAESPPGVDPVRWSERHAHAVAAVNNLRALVL